MSNLDQHMTTCPLKHEIRTKLWENYLLKLENKNIKYLTLYSPSFMDIKYFLKKNYLIIEKGLIKNVAAVTNNRDDYSKAISNSPARPEFFKNGDIVDIVNGKKQNDIKKSFPFDVINLDYCDQIHRRNNKDKISNELLTIDKILKLQKNKNGKFSLFITTKINKDGYSDEFIEKLNSIMNDNFSKLKGFDDAIKSRYNTENLKDFQSNNINDYYSLSIIKMILLFLKKNSFKIIEGNAVSLIRNSKKIKQYLLHFAFLIGNHNQNFKELKDIENNNPDEYSIEIIKKGIQILNEKDHWYDLNKKHFSELNELKNMTFQNENVFIPPSENSSK